MSHVGIGLPCNCGETGWMPGVEHAPIRWQQPPMTKLALTPLAIVDHIMQGYLQTMVDWTINAGSTVVVHFGIDRRGRIVQMHPVNRVGRHASAIYSPQSKIVQREGQHSGTTGANGYTIAIEHEGCAVDPRPAYTVPAEMIYSKTNPWPEAMVQASIRVKKWLFENVPTLGKPSRDTIIGHYEIDARNRPDDPASSKDRSVWPVDRMIAALAGVTQEVAVETNYAVVKPGETLGQFAARVKVSVASLAQLNAIPDVNKVQAWQVLRLNESVPKPPLLSFSAGPQKPDVSVSKAQVAVIRRAADILDADLEKIGGV